MARIFVMLLLVLSIASPAWPYQLFTDNDNGGNVKLDKKTYKVYIGKEPEGSGFRQEVVDALTKWKTALAGRGITLDIQAGEPPQQPVDVNKYNAEIEQYNKDADPNPADYPEMAKYDAKKDTISIYFASTDDINSRGGTAGDGLAQNFWSLDADGHAGPIDESDVFVPTDPPGGTDEIQKQMLHNIALHEGGHVAGFDHYTSAQISAGGEVMQHDATLFADYLSLGDEETKGLNAMYGEPPKVDVQSEATQQDTSALPGSEQSYIPPGIDSVWEYSYDLAWLEGSEVSFFQVQTGGAGIFYAWGSGGLEDWLARTPGPGENYLDFYADGLYLNGDNPTGRLSFLTAQAPGRGWLVYQDGAQTGVAPVPEPASGLMVLGGLAGLFGWHHRARRS